MFFSSFLQLLIISAILSVIESFVGTRVLKIPLTIHHYDYFKKGEKREAGRLLKNIMFPGIYREYEDTKPTIKTVKVEEKKVEQAKKNTRNAGAKLDTIGTFNMENSIETLDRQDRLMKMSLKPVRKPDGFVAPAPKKGLSVGGAKCLPNLKEYNRPTKPIVLYDFENSDDCRKVREACTLLDVNIETRPCPGEAYGFSDMMATATKGRRDVPFMIDNNPSMYRPSLFGANDIIDHLFETYGPGAAAVPNNLKSRATVSTSNAPTKKSSFSGKGSRTKDNARPDNTKMKPITLYGFEGARPVKVVRDALSELGLSYILINCAQGSANRDKLMKLTGGLFQVPYLVDPNTGVSMFESKEMVDYLNKVYTY